MKFCPLCEKHFGNEAEVCSIDGANLIAAAESKEPFIGRVIKGRYHVLKKLGEGGMGTVYLCEQLSVARKVALKLLHAEYGREQEIVRRFRHEAHLSASLSHPNIMTIYDFDQTEDGTLFIAMEYLEGRTLRDLIRKGPMDIGEVVRLGIQIGDGLAAAHRAGVIHRDLKPENIMVVDDGQSIKLMDFGIARLRDSSTTTTITRVGTIMGTPAYMAPEQIEGFDITEQTDIYAYGIVLYEMLVGNVPFRGPTPSGVLIKQLNESPPSIRKMRPEISIGIEKVVMQALEKKSAVRQKSALEIVSALKQFGESSATGDSSATMVADTQTVLPKRKAGWWKKISRGFRDRNAIESVGELRAEIESAVQSVFKNTLTSVRDLELRMRSMSEGVDAVKSSPGNVHLLENSQAPTAFFSEMPGRTTFFREGPERYESVQETLRFYREHLEREYRGLARQADVTYLLWVCCVSLGFIVLMAAVILLLYSKLAEGVATAVGTLLVYFIQRIFQMREDHYRSLAGAKIRHLEYGNQWLLVIQSIDAIENQTERVKRQAGLADALTRKLREAKLHMDSDIREARVTQVTNKSKPRNRK